MPAYIVGADIQNRIGAAAYLRLFDDNNDGAADADPIAQVIADAQAKVDGYLRGAYSLDEVAANPPNQVKRLCLDVAQAYLAMRHPMAVRIDWEKLLQAAERDLKRLRTGEIRLDVVGAPEPATNEGGEYAVGDPDTYDATTFKRTFLDGTGDF